MLVLARKIGQQIVLPGCGVTIDVVGVTKSQVRLGIEAPSGVPVYRRELLDRIQRQSQAAGKAELKNPIPAPADEAEGANAVGASPPDLDRCLAKWIAHRTNGRIRRLSVKTDGDRTVISGCATSYYARQLAQAAVSEVFDRWSSFPLPNVDYKIDIVDRTFVSRAGGNLLFSTHADNAQPG